MITIIMQKNEILIKTLKTLLEKVGKYKYLNNFFKFLGVFPVKFNINESLFVARIAPLVF